MTRVAIDFSFRAWHAGEREMVYFDFDDVQRGRVMEPCFDGRYCALNECVVMQSTGLIDRYGATIYEGDILQFDVNEWGGPEDSRFVVEWDDTGAAFVGNGGVPDWSEWCAVIGNVHEQPEMERANQGRRGRELRGF